MTFEELSSRWWKVTTPAFFAPSMLVHAMRSSGFCSVIFASHSRLVPAISATQCNVVSSICLTLSTPSMKRGNSSNWVHWLYAVRTGTLSSIDCSAVDISNHLRVSGLFLSLLMCTQQIGCLSRRSKRGGCRGVGRRVHLAHLKEVALPRLRKVSCADPGFTRRKRGRGFEYLDFDGNRITDPEILQRMKDLTLP